MNNDFGPHANPVKEVWNNGRLHSLAFNVFFRVICEICVRFFFPHANSANLAKVYFITFKLL